MLKKLFVAVFVLGFFAQAVPVAQAKDDKPVVTCPVTGQPVKDPDKAAKSEYKGKTYYFCCPGCKPKFDKDPEKYVGKQGEGPKGHKHSCGAGSDCGHEGH